ncbi:MAG: hypothetical protein ACKO1H_02030 [Tabrizicola sp.]
MDHFARLDADIRQGLSQAFVEAAESRLQWEYSASFDEADRRGVRMPFDHGDEYGQLLLQRHMGARHHLGSTALRLAAQQVGGTVEQLLLSNGQRKVIALVGPFCFIAETLTEFPHKPEFANYKGKLARTYGAIRQLELDLGDGFAVKEDWSGRHLGVLLHGCIGTSFSRSGTSLSAFRVAFPNAEYDSWVWEADVLSGQLADRVGWHDIRKNKPKQVDKVAVSLRALSEAKDKA